MGLTLIRKSDGTRPVANPTVALVLAGGAISGGAFKVGGLKALNDFLVDRKITDLDLYVGLSAGAILGSSLAAGVSPDEMIRVLDGTSTRLDQLRPFDRKTGKRLYVTACDLDTAERVIFGADENCELSISQAVQASSALPIFYKPARINGVDYVDGGVRHTANIDVAIEKGADLIICYNPFRPFLNRIDAEDSDTSYFAEGRYLADRGMKAIINQVFRTLLHSRLKLGIQRYLADDRFRGDIVLLEPRENDADYFSTNPMAFWKRSRAVQHGFESVRSTLEQNFEQLESVFARYGIQLDREAARRRAARARVAQGWQEDAPAEPAPPEEPPAGLRLVGS